MSVAPSDPVEGAQSIRRVVSILRILASGQESGVRVADIVLQTQLKRSTIHRMLRVLVDEGLAEQDADTRRYGLGREATLLGLARRGMFPIRGIADPFLRALAKDLGDSVFLTVRSGADSICVDRKTGTYPIQVLSVEIGARRPLGVGVGGVVLLGCLPSDETAAIVAQNARRLEAYGLTAARVTERVERMRERGYAYTEAGVVPGTRAVSVPVRGPNGAALAAISVSTVTARLPLARARLIVGRMREQAGLMSRAAGKARR
ncbi:MAG: IclR family transcriptional regulator [Casimicrobiaceae bacterium]